MSKKKIDKQVTRAGMAAGAAMLGAESATVAAIGGKVVATTAAATTGTLGVGATAAAGAAITAAAPVILGGALLYGAFRLFSDD